jgi:hypothetical protein
MLRLSYGKTCLGYLAWILLVSLKRAGSGKGATGKAMMWTFKNVEILVPFIDEGDGSQMEQRRLSLNTLNFNRVWP